MDKHTFYYRYLTEHGMTPSEADNAIRLDKIVSVDSARRAYNEIKPNKNKAKEKEYKDIYSIARDNRPQTNLL